MRQMVALGAVVLVLGGCSRDDDDPDGRAEPRPSSPAPSSTASGSPAEIELRAAVQAYSDASLTGKVPAALRLMSQRCRDTMDEQQFTAEVELNGSMHSEPLELQSYDAEVDGKRALVSYTYVVVESDTEPTGEPWVLESGGWRNDAC